MIGGSVVTASERAHVGLTKSRQDDEEARAARRTKKRARVSAEAEHDLDFGDLLLTHGLAGSPQVTRVGMLDGPSLGPWL